MRICLDAEKLQAKIEAVKEARANGRELQDEALAAELPVEEWIKAQRMAEFRAQVREWEAVTYLLVYLENAIRAADAS